MATVFYKNFEWDEQKNIVNQQKHNISFEVAVHIFDDIFLEALTKDNYGEKRWIALGRLENKEIVVISTHRQERKRIISARRARENERKAYKRFLEKNHD